MKLETPLSIVELAELLDAELVGNPDVIITHLNEIHKVCKGSLIFVDNESYFTQAIYSSASALIVNQKVECPPNKALLIVHDPFEAYNSLALRFLPFVPLTANISASAKIGKNTIIEPGVVVGHHTTIGDNCLIRANTVICSYTEIGNNVQINSNTSIGNDAFYFHRNEDGSYKPWHSIGKVIIEDDVRIGSSCTIDRGVSGDTVIGRGSKLDDQIHVGHGVVIGHHCLIAAQSGIAGKTIIQDHVTIYGQVGISKGLVIGEGAVILAQTGVSKSIPGGKRYVGSPAAGAYTRFKEYAAIRRLPGLMKKLDKIERYMDEEEDKEA